MASFHCNDNSNVFATQIITNFHFHLIQLWWQFFQTFVYGDRRSLCSNLRGIDPEKLYRATQRTLIRPVEMLLIPPEELTDN